MTEYYTFRKKPNFWAFFYFIFLFFKKDNYICNGIKIYYFKYMEKTNHVEAIMRGLIDSYGQPIFTGFGGMLFDDGDYEHLTIGGLSPFTSVDLRPKDCDKTKCESAHDNTEMPNLMDGIRKLFNEMENTETETGVNPGEGTWIYCEKTNTWGTFITLGEVDSISAHVTDDDDILIKSWLHNGGFSRSHNMVLSLPDDADASTLETKYDEADGVLNLTVSKLIRKNPTFTYCREK